MTKRNNTKRALIGSLLSMMVCLAMLIGSTFAWFSDSVVSGKNQIVAGNLDVELYHKNAFETTEQKVDNVTNLFCDKEGNPIKWEPGVVAYENFTVKNVGNLALQYQLKVNVSDYNTVTVGTEEKSLKDVLKVAILDGSHFSGDRATAISKITPTTTSSIADFNKSGNLLPGTAGNPTTKDFAMIIYWQPTENDNDFNINNGKKLAKKNGANNELFIDLGVTLSATQFTHENDSFNDQYDVEASIPKFVTSNEDARDVIESGGNVTLNNDVTVEDGVQLSITEDTNLNFNGNTLNGTVESGSINGEPANTTLSDPNNDGSKPTIDGDIKFDDGGGMTQFAGVSAWAPTVTIESGKYMHNNAVVHCQLQGGDTNADKNGIVINGGTFEGKGAAVVVYDVIGNVEINGGTFIAHANGDASGECVYLSYGDNIIPTITTINGGTFNAERRLFTIEPNADYVQKIEVNGGTFTVAEGGKLVEIDGSGSAEGILVIKGGTFNVDPSAYVDTNTHTVTSSNGTWTVTAK